MHTLSLFDGMACGALAMQAAEIGIDSYNAYEIEKYAIKTANHNFPFIKQHGDVFGANFAQFEGVDLVCGGSPCTYWSIAQKNGRETEASGMGWDLFQQYARAIKEAKPKYFIYENNKSMSDAIKDSISDTFDFEPIHINSALVSAQNRQRYYWVGMRKPNGGGYTKINIELPEDRGILLRDILESGVVDKEKAYCLKHQAGNARDYLKKHHTQVAFEPVDIDGAAPINPLASGKSRCVTAGYADEVIKGGTGYAIELQRGKEIFIKEKHHNLPPRMELMFPDYALYPKYKEAYGFLTRGCRNNCSFCIVTQKEGMCSRQVANLKDFWNGQSKIKLLDHNLLACKDREMLIDELIDSKVYVDFTQGLDARFIDDNLAKRLNQIKISAVHFAFDFMKNETAIIKGLQTFKKYYKGDMRGLRCYVLTNYDTTSQEDWYRVKILSELGFTPDVRIYQKGTQPQFLTDLARWSNNMRLKRSVSFEDYIPRVDGKTCGEIYKHIIK